MELDEEISKGAQLDEEAQTHTSLEHKLEMELQLSVTQLNTEKCKCKRLADMNQQLLAEVQSLREKYQLNRKLETLRESELQCNSTVTIQRVAEEHEQITQSTAFTNTTMSDAQQNEVEDSDDDSKEDILTVLDDIHHRNYYYMYNIYIYIYIPVYIHYLCRDFLARFVCVSRDRSAT